MKINFIILLFCLSIFIHQTTSAGLPLSVYEQKKFQTAIESQGLYNASDNVIPLTGANLKLSVFGKKHASLVEFYNSYCGFCRRYASVWKEFSHDIYGWRDIIIVAAIDCSVDENNGVCRDFEVMAYPSIRYFSPNYQDEGENRIGDAVKGHDVPALRETVVQKLLTETNRQPSWPRLQANTEALKRETLFNGLSETIKYVFLITESETSTAGVEIILDFHTIPEISLIRITSADNPHTVQLSVIDRGDGFQSLSVNGTREGFNSLIKEFLKTKSINTTKIDESKSVGSHESTEISHSSQNASDFKMKVKLMKDKLFYADLEQALKYTIFHEISGSTTIDGEKLVALQGFLTVLAKYFPLGRNGERFLKGLRDNVLNITTELSGKTFLNKANELQLLNVPVFSSNRWVRCHSDLKGLRGFPCGLWLMFHYLSVQAAESNEATDPLEILQTMHRYIKNYFGCTDCSRHFQDMATRRRIWSVASKDEAVLWLWEAHNEVNSRLSGDITEDPEYPKIQFPTIESCSECRKQSPSGFINNESIEWDKTEVLFYMKRTYSLQNLSQFGVANDEQLPQSLKNILEKRFLGNVFSDLDMRMGMLLYVFCIVMMVVAVKLFKRRGYRKKMYVHDILGKV